MLFDRAVTSICVVCGLKKRKWEFNMQISIRIEIKNNSHGLGHHPIWLFILMETDLTPEYCLSKSTEIWLVRPVHIISNFKKYWYSSLKLLASIDKTILISCPWLFYDDATIEEEVRSDFNILIMWTTIESRRKDYQLRNLFPSIYNTSYRYVSLKLS